jgi:nicotinamide-nucleotide amidase
MRIEEKIGMLLRERGLSLATAESCTGGLVADRITDIPGSSEYFLGGVVAYDNRIKAEVLKVPQGVLDRQGAVSEATVRAMAEGARTLLKADLAVSVSGVAGPGGGSEEKPVGTTWIGLAAREGTRARQFCWDGDLRASKARNRRRENKAGQRRRRWRWWWNIWYGVEEGEVGTPSSASGCRRPGSG